MMIKHVASPCEGLTLKEITSTISNLLLACFFALPQRCEISRREKDEMEASGVNVARFIAVLRMQNPSAPKVLKVLGLV